MSDRDHESEGERVSEGRGAEEAEMEGPPFLSFSTVKVAQANTIPGVLNGYTIGFVGVYSTLHDMSEDCYAYEGEEPCKTLSNSKCLWTGTSATKKCVWKNQIDCYDSYKSSGSCGNDKYCEWNYDDGECHNKHGYDTVNSGIFAASMILGCTVGSMGGGYVVTNIGMKRSFLVCGLVGTISSVLYHISTAATIFGLLCTARALIGVVLGVVCIAAPMYVNVHAHPKNRKSIGVLFQVATTLGIFLAALMGLLLGQTIDKSGSKDAHVKDRMQGLCAFSTLLSVLVTLLGIFLNDKSPKEGEEEAGEAKDEAQLLNQDEYSWGEMTGPLFLGAVVAGTLQLTGINAVMNYAPTIMDSYGFAPLVGNFVVMAWNFVTCIVSIPLASFVSMRHMFLFGSGIASVACLLLCGIPVYPGVADDNVKDAVAITGIFIFIAAFEIGIGPCFYVLAQDLFPPSFRPKGSSFTMLVQFFFNTLINAFYPSAVKGISGGAAGDQNKGQAVAFILFGGIGLVCFVIQFFFLFPWDDSKSKPAAEPIADAAPEEREE